MEVEENESENKPFDAELAQDGEETQPDPDEHMITDSATGKVWIVKVSNHIHLIDSRLLTSSGRFTVDSKISDGTVVER